MDHNKFHNLLFAILLLISFANATNATGNGTDDWKDKSHLIQESFDNAIGQFVGQFATNPESSTSDANDQQQQQQQLTHLTYKDAAHILKGIEEIVANKLIAAGEKKHDIEMGNFHAILGQIVKDILHREMEWKWGQNANLQQALESIEPKNRKITNDQLVDRLLKFAIRMGFTIGQMALNAAVMHERKPQIDLHKFVRAQDYFYRKNWLDWVKTDLPKVWFKNMPNENLLKLDFNPNKWDEQDERHINQNLATIEMLLLNSTELTIDGWLSVVVCIRKFRLDNKAFANCSNIAEKLLIQLMTSWTGTAISGRHLVQPIEYCAANKFAMNLVECMSGVETIRNYLPKNMKDIEESEAQHYDRHCTHEKLLANGSEMKNEKLYQSNEFLMYTTEPFLHYEDAIPLHGLKADKEIEIENAKTESQKKLHEWQTIFDDCQMHSDDDVNKVPLSVIGEECDFKDFSYELLKFEREIEPSINAAFRLLNMDESMQILLKLNRTLEEEIETANNNIRSVRYRRRGLGGRLLASKFEAQQKTDIKAEVEKTKRQFADSKKAMLLVFKALMFDCGGSFSNKSS